MLGQAFSHVRGFLVVVEPLFKAARCTYETTCMCFSILAFSGRRATIVLTFVLVTERSKHASDIAKNLPLDVGYDALVLLSGDGLIHEVFNGFAEHEQL